MNRSNITDCEQNFKMHNCLFPSDVPSSQAYCERAGVAVTVPPATTRRLSYLLNKGITVMSKGRREALEIAFQKWTVG